MTKLKALRETVHLPELHIDRSELSASYHAGDSHLCFEGRFTVPDGNDGSSIARAAAKPPLQERFPLRVERFAVQPELRRLDHRA